MDKTQKKATPKNRPHGFKISGRVGDPGTLASHALEKSQDKRGANLRELLKQNLELEKKIRNERKRGFELWRRIEKCPIKGWWEVPIEQLSLEDLILQKRRFEELRNRLTESIGDRATDSHGNNSDQPSRTDS